MADTIVAGDFQAKLQRLDKLLRDAERAGDPAARARTREIVQAVLEVHGLAFESVIAHLNAAGKAGAAVLDACTADPVVSGMLLLHGLHPLSLEERVEQALEDVRPFLRAHGGNVDFLDVADGVVRLRLEGSCDGCPSSAVTMKQTIEEAIVARAPDAAAVEVEGVVEPPAESVGDRALFALPVV
jgi:Fe-S cluster biogenesis protein NfuA